MVGGQVMSGCSSTLLLLLYIFELTATQIWNSLDAFQERAIFDDEMRSAVIVVIVVVSGVSGIYHSCLSSAN